MSDFHPETWSPIWSVSTIIIGFISFMTSDEFSAGVVNTTDDQKRELAKKTMAQNMGNEKFKRFFADHLELLETYSMLANEQ